jgi:hypothetical protein
MSSQIPRNFQISGCEPLRDVDFGESPAMAFSIALRELMTLAELVNSAKQVLETTVENIAKAQIEAEMRLASLFYGCEAGPGIRATPGAIKQISYTLSVVLRNHKEHIERDLEAVRVQSKADVEALFGDALTEAATRQATVVMDQSAAAAGRHLDAALGRVNNTLVKVAERTVALETMGEAATEQLEQVIQKAEAFVNARTKATWQRRVLYLLAACAFVQASISVLDLGKRMTTKPAVNAAAIISCTIVGWQIKDGVCYPAPFRIEPK